MGTDPLSETARLLAGARVGDPEQRSQLLWRYRDPLTRLLRGKLAPCVPLEPADLAQGVLMTALSSLQVFEYRGAGSLWRYLRKIGLQRACEENRKYLGRPQALQDSATLGSLCARESQDPAEMVSAKEASEAFEAALCQLDDQVHGALLLRIELGFSYDDIAVESGYPSADAARMAIGRGLHKLSRTLAAWKE